MGAIIKKSQTITAKWKEIAVVNNEFVDPETGEVVDIARILESSFGTNEVFSLSASNKVDTDLEVGGNAD